MVKLVLPLPLHRLFSFLVLSTLCTDFPPFVESKAARAAPAPSDQPASPPFIFPFPLPPPPRAFPFPFPLPPPPAAFPFPFPLPPLPPPVNDPGPSPVPPPFVFPFPLPSPPPASPFPFPFPFPLEKQKESSGGLNGGQKAGIAIGVLAGTGLIVFGGLVYKKRHDNIRRVRFSNAARDTIL